MCPLKYFLTFLLAFLSLNAAFADDNKNRVEIYRILMPKGDTTFWNANACTLKDDGSFTCFCYYGCSREEMLANQLVDDFDDPIEFPLCVRNRHVDPKIVVGDTFYTDLNFGAHRKTDYIPYANIPEFNRDSIANFFRTIPKEKCSRIIEHYGDYLFEAVGLPEGLVLKSDWEKNMYYERCTRDGICFRDETCPMEYIVHYEKNVCQLDKDVNCWLIHPRIGGLGNKHRCEYKRLTKDEIEYAKYYLFNTRSENLPDTTFAWKLIYKDQYGRGDTLEITTTVR